MLDYQGRRRAESENSRELPVLTVGIIGAVYTNGATVKFPGDTAASVKRYKYNLDAVLNAGDRVLLGRVGGSYVIICRF